MSDEIVIRIYALWIVISRMYVFDNSRFVRSVSISWKLKLERESRRNRGWGGGCVKFSQVRYHLARLQTTQVLLLRCTKKPDPVKPKIIVIHHWTG